MVALTFSRLQKGGVEGRWGEGGGETGGEEDVVVDDGAGDSLGPVAGGVDGGVGAAGVTSLPSPSGVEVPSPSGVEVNHCVKPLNHCLMVLVQERPVGSGEVVG